MGRFVHRDRKEHRQRDYRQQLDMIDCVHRRIIYPSSGDFCPPSTKKQRSSARHRRIRPGLAAAPGSVCPVRGGTVSFPDAETIEADIVKQKQQTDGGGFTAIGFGRTRPRVHQEHCLDTSAGTG
jgi:hypothetical protein